MMCYILVLLYFSRIISGNFEYDDINLSTSEMFRKSELFDFNIIKTLLKMNYYIIIYVNPRFISVLVELFV